MLTDKPLRLKRRLVTIGVCAALLIAMWALTFWPAGLERGYAQGVFQFARGLSRVTGLVSVSLAEFVLAAVVLLILAGTVLGLVQYARRQRTIGNLVASGTMRLMTATAVVLVLFYLLWGLNYARAPLPVRLGWKPIDRPVNGDESDHQTEEIAALTRQLIAATNENYRLFANSDDLGYPTVRLTGLTPLDMTLDAAYPRVQQLLGLESGFAARRGPAKPLAASLLLNYLQLGGFYFPWTGEANYNRLMPSPTVPHAVAHEKAHQRGIAREDEANFIGYLACAMSDDAYTRYSGYLFAQQQLLGELVRRDLNRARELAALRSKGVVRDLEFIREFWQQYEGPAARMSEQVNNSYLRSQGERRGIAAYAASRSLIVLFARNNQGRATLQ